MESFHIEISVLFFLLPQLLQFIFKNKFLGTDDV
jgi:hypothetical protein